MSSRIACCAQVRADGASVSARWPAAASRSKQATRLAVEAHEAAEVLVAHDAQVQREEGDERAERNRRVQLRGCGASATAASTPECARSDVPRHAAGLTHLQDGLQRHDDHRRLRVLHEEEAACVVAQAAAHSRALGLMVSRQGLLGFWGAECSLRASGAYRSAGRPGAAADTGWRRRGARRRWASRHHRGAPRTRRTRGGGQPAAARRAGGLRPTTALPALQGGEREASACVLA